MWDDKQKKFILDAIARGDKSACPISQAIKDIKNISLTKWGQIALSGFPDRAIVYTDEALGYFPMIQHPFEWFLSVARKYCADQSLDIDHDWVRQLKIAFKQPVDDTLIKFYVPRDISSKPTGDFSLLPDGLSQEEMTRRLTEIEKLKAHRASKEFQRIKDIPRNGPDLYKLLNDLMDRCIANVAAFGPANQGEEQMPSWSKAAFDYNKKYNKTCGIDNCTSYCSGKKKWYGPGTWY